MGTRPFTISSFTINQLELLCHNFLLLEIRCILFDLFLFFKLIYNHITYTKNLNLYLDFSIS